MKTFKRIMFNVIAAVVLAMSAFCLTACEDIKTLQVKIRAEENEYTLTVDLYRHLAPNTVDTIIDYVKEGYYNDALFYKMDGYSSQLMVGDLKEAGGEITLNANKPQIKGEFENNGVKGSNLKAASGYIGLWRSWYSHDGSYNLSSSARDSARATWFIPTGDISGYNGNFCIFAQYDSAKKDNAAALEAINGVFADSAKYESYTIYYTGTYDDKAVDNNFGLTFHCVLTEDYDESKIEDLFEADNKQNQLVQYNVTKVNIPVNFSVKILSVTVA